MPYKVMNLSDIIISDNFKKHNPATRKMQTCHDYYITHGKFDRNIVLDNNNILIDGYCAYLCAHIFGLSTVEVVF